MRTTGKLSDNGILKLREKLEKLNRRAVRLGMDELTMTITLREAVKQTTPSGLDSTVWINHVEVNGCAPRINGWTVAARIEFTEAGNLVHCAPGVDGTDCRYRNAKNVCEHCNTDRRRNDIIVIRHSDGSEKLVGRNCLADYIRTDNVESLLAYAGWISESVFSDCEGGDYIKPVETIESIVQAASICIRKIGWKSSTNFDGDSNSTKSDVSTLLFPPRNRAAYTDWTKWINENDLHVCDFDKDLAGKVIAWAQSLESGQSDYLANLKVLANLEAVGIEKFGYVVSMIPAYNKAMERETEYKNRAEKKGEKVYIGQPKKRMKGIKAICVGLKSFDGNYGVTTLVRFEQRVSESEYAVLVWFASGDKIDEFEVGNEYTFDATVKDHNDHPQYGKQVVINRTTVK